MGRLQVRLESRNRSLGADGRNGCWGLQQRSGFRGEHDSDLRSGDNDARQRRVHTPDLHRGIQRAESGLLQRPRQLHPKRPVQPNLQVVSASDPNRQRDRRQRAEHLLPQNTDASQHSGTIRFDQNFGNNNQVSFRYSQFDLYKTNPSNTIGNAFVHVPGHNYIGHWTHEYSPTTFSDVYFGRNWGFTTTGTSWAGEAPAFFTQLQPAGMSNYFMTLNNTIYAPQFTADNYFGLGGSQLQGTGLGDIWQFGGSFTKIFGRHTIKAGADFESNDFTSPIAYSNENFSVTSDREPRIKQARAAIAGRLCCSAFPVQAGTGIFSRKSGVAGLTESCGGPVQSDSKADRQSRLPQRLDLEPDLWDRQRRQLLYRQCQSRHRPV